MKRNRRTLGEEPGEDESSSTGSESEMEAEELPEEASAENMGPVPNMDAESPPLKIPKLTKGELYKPPTNEELNQLRETENLFQSSLFRMQISELLQEVTVTENKAVKDFLHQLKNFLLKLDPSKVYDLTDQRWVHKMKIKVPLQQEPYIVKGKFSFHPPKTVKVMGSYVTGTCIKPEPHVDVAVEIPAECFQRKDYLNEKYLRKRTLYLCHIAGKLKGHDLIKDVKFMYHHGNHMKPILVIQPSGKAGKLLTIHLHTTPAKGYFKLNRFHIEKNNVRPSWYNGEPEQEHDEDVQQVPTPHHNSTILTDLTQEDHLNLMMSHLHEKEELMHGVALLKVWLHLRELDQGYGGFSGFIMTMLVIYLLSKRRLSRMMSSYQIMRNTLLEITKLNLDHEGITLCGSPDSEAPTMEDFHKHFDVVFVDSTGYLNLCANVTKNTFERVKQEAKMSIDNLNDPGVDGMESLLLSKVPFSLKFDHVFHLTQMEHLQSAVSKFNIKNELMDHSGDHVHTVLPHLLQLVSKALGNRIKLLAPKLEPTKVWSVNNEPPHCNLLERVSFGLILDTAHSTSVLEKGPPADSKEAKSFQTFWGKKSELRRFQDGSICEAVVWPCSTLAKQRLVCGKIIKHILQIGADINSKSVHYIGGQLDTLLQIGQLKMKAIPYGTGEEQHISIMRAYNSLSKELRQLRDLPLSINSIQGTSPVFRFAEVFPTVQSKRTGHQDLSIYDDDGTVNSWSQAMTVIVMMEGSGKWPEDKDAIKRIKAAFHIKLSELLEEHCKLTTKAFTDHILILKHGYVFKLKIAYHREIAMLKMVKTPEGMVKMIDTKKSLQMEEDVVALPQLTSALHGVQQKHNTFSGTVRLAKRWITSQMLSGYIRDEAVELIVASLYLRPAPFTVPSCPQTGFLRFLNLLTQHDWKVTPVIVNLNDELKVEDYREIRTNFSKKRSSLPLMFIATPFDKLQSLWTLHQPTAQILQRMVLLAQESLGVIQGQLMLTSDNLDHKLTFRPPLEIYNVLIHLRPSRLPRRNQGVDLDEHIQLPVLTSEENSGRAIPAVDFDPVQRYLSELRCSFGDMAMFFHDEFGGRVIGVLWKPGALDLKPFKVHNLSYHTPATDSENQDKVVVNIDAVLEDFWILGLGLVNSVEKRTKSGQWKTVHGS